MRRRKETEPVVLKPEPKKVFTVSGVQRMLSSGSPNDIVRALDAKGKWYSIDGMLVRSDGTFTLCLVPAQVAKLKP